MGAGHHESEFTRLKHHFLASLFAAATVGITTFFTYAFLSPTVGAMAGAIAAFVTFCLALILSLPFLAARKRLSETAYFLLHLGVGLVLGAVRASMNNPYVSELRDYLYNYDALLVSCASIAAWLYVFLFVPAGKRSENSDIESRRNFSPIVLPFGLIVLCITIGTAPVPSDPSCHNVLRDGRLSARASVVMRVTVADQDIRELIKTYETFADDYALSIRGHAVLPDAPQRSLCNDDVTIRAGGVHSGRQKVGFYEAENGSGWEPMARDLVCRLEARWGESITFTGGGGELIPKPEIIAGSCPPDEP